LPEPENFLLNKCAFKLYNQEVLNSCDGFVCGHKDLDSFFKDDVIHFSSQLMGKTHCFTLEEEPEVIVAAFTISNDSIKNDLPNNRKKKILKHIPRGKIFRSYPAVLIGRLGVHQKYQGTSVSTELMDFIKAWFIDPNNKTGCRFLVVDSYNESRPIRYYEKNGFEMIFGSEEQEKEYLKIEPDKKLKTRLMQFDLILLGAHPPA
jgi:GNAT superfamily N-acetyltransferase